MGPPRGSPVLGQGSTVPPARRGGLSGSHVPNAREMCWLLWGLGRAQHPRGLPWGPPPPPAGLSGEETLVLVVKSPLKGWGMGWGEQGRERAHPPGMATASRGRPPWDTRPLAAPSPGAWGELGCPAGLGELMLQPPAPESSSATLPPPGSSGRRGTRCRAALPLLRGGTGAPAPSPSPWGWTPPAPLPGPFPAGEAGDGGAERGAGDGAGSVPAAG